MLGAVLLVGGEQVERGWGAVRLVHLIRVEEEEELLATMLLEPAQTCGEGHIDLPARVPDARALVLAIVTDAPLEARGRYQHGVLGHRGSLVAVGGEELGEGRDPVRQSVYRAHHTVHRGVDAGHHRHVGCGGGRVCGDSLFEEYALSREPVEHRRRGQLAAVRSDVVGTEGVDRYEHEVAFVTAWSRLQDLGRAPEGEAEGLGLSRAGNDVRGEHEARGRPGERVEVQAVVMPLVGPGIGGVEYGANEFPLARGRPCKEPELGGRRVAVPPHLVHRDANPEDRAPSDRQGGGLGGLHRSRDRARADVHVDGAGRGIGRERQADLDILTRREARHGRGEHPPRRAAREADPGLNDETTLAEGGGQPVAAMEDRAVGLDPHLGCDGHQGRAGERRADLVVGGTGGGGPCRGKEDVNRLEILVGAPASTGETREYDECEHQP